MKGQDFNQHVAYVWEAHSKYPSEPGKDVRLWDQQTPYAIHPFWCATSILTETSLEENFRWQGALALLYHDILEDTLQPLPEGLDPRVVEFVQDMTFAGGFEEEKEAIWSYSDEVRLLKVYDKVSNLLDGTWMSEQKNADYCEFTRKLVQSVEGKWPGLHVYGWVERLPARS